MEQQARIEGARRPNHQKLQAILVFCIVDSNANEPNTEHNAQSRVKGRERKGREGRRRVKVGKSLRR